MEPLPLKKIFISYSWSSPEHDDWFLSLAHQLMNDGVDVVLDKWNLKEGQDKYHFMESMVTAVDIDKVLIVCDEKYASKADNRAGGVGTETQIITPQVYNQVNQEKFIPVVCQMDENGQAHLPAYLKSLIYINLSLDVNYALEYEKLLRNIYNRPSLSKSKLGKAPAYLLEDSPIAYKTTTMLRGMDVQLDKYAERINSFVRDFLEEFDNNLLDFKIDNPGETYLEVGKQAIDRLTQYIPLRDDYLNFINKLTKNDRHFDTGLLIKFFEGLPLHLHSRTEGSPACKPGTYDHFKFINHELFIYTIAIALKNDNYRVLEDMLLSKYFFKIQGQQKSEPLDYDYLRNNYNYFEQYHQQLTCRKSDNAHTEVLMSRIPDFISKNDVVAGDLLCYHIGQLNNIDWFPVTYGFNGKNRGDFDFFNRLISRKHFEKVKLVLGVEQVEEFKERLQEIITKGPDPGYSNYRGRIPSIEYYIMPEKVATLK